MARKDQNEPFIVSDKRKFTSEGELRPDSQAAAHEATPQVSGDPAVTAPVAEQAAPARQTTTAGAEQEVAARRGDEGTGAAAAQGQVITHDDAEAVPPPPSAEEQRDQEAAYKRSNTAIDSTFGEELVGAEGHEQEQGSAQSFEMTFERLIASLYMTAMMQLGMARPEGGQPQTDIIGARQTIDTLTLLNDKTKGNLTKEESNLLQNCLFELRMAYIEITNRIVQPPPAGKMQQERG